MNDNVEVAKSHKIAQNFFLSYLFTWLLQVLVVAHGIFSPSLGALSCGTWDLSSLTKAQTLAPALGAQSLNHWTAREVPRQCLSLALGMPESPWSHLRVPGFLEGWRGPQTRGPLVLSLHQEACLGATQTPSCPGDLFFLADPHPTPAKSPMSPSPPGLWDRELSLRPTEVRSHVHMCLIIKVMHAHRRNCSKYKMHIKQERKPAKISHHCRPPSPPTQR